MLEWIAAFIVDSPLTMWVEATYWIWPILEITHFFGLSLLLGGLIIIDLRLAGHFKALPLIATHQLLPFVFIGFGLNLITGILFFYGDPLRYAVNIGFQIKMALVFLDVLNALLYYWKIHPVIHTWNSANATPPIARFVAYASLTIWSGVLVCGRLLPYVGDTYG